MAVPSQASKPITTCSRRTFISGSLRSLILAKLGALSPAAGTEALATPLAATVSEPTRVIKKVEAFVGFCNFIGADSPLPGFTPGSGAVHVDMSSLLHINPAVVPEAQRRTVLNAAVAKFSQIFNTEHADKIDLALLTEVSAELSQPDYVKEKSSTRKALKLLSPPSTKSVKALARLSRRPVSDTPSESDLSFYAEQRLESALGFLNTMLRYNSQIAERLPEWTAICGEGAYAIRILDCFCKRGIGACAQMIAAEPTLIAEGEYHIALRDYHLSFEPPQDIQSRLDAFKRLSKSIKDLEEKGAGGRRELELEPENVTEPLALAHNRLEPFLSLVSRYCSYHLEVFTNGTKIEFARIVPKDKSQLLTRGMLDSSLFDESMSPIHLGAKHVALLSDILRKRLGGKRGRRTLEFFIPDITWIRSIQPILRGED